jgi:hypothetical protein
MTTMVQRSWEDGAAFVGKRLLDQHYREVCFSPECWAQLLARQPGSGAL